MLGTIDLALTDADQPLYDEDFGGAGVRGVRIIVPDTSSGSALITIRYDGPDGPTQQVVLAPAAAETSPASAPPTPGRIHRVDARRADDGTAAIATLRVVML